MLRDVCGGTPWSTSLNGVSLRSVSAAFLASLCGTAKLLGQFLLQPVLPETPETLHVNLPPNPAEIVR
jgi:hypothetical protein